SPRGCDPRAAGIWQGWHGFAEAVRRRRGKPQDGRPIQVGSSNSDRTHKTGFRCWRTQVVPTCATPTIQNATPSMIRLDCLTLSYSRLFSGGQYDVFRFLDICRELSLDGVALHADSLSGKDRPYLKRVRRRCLDLGLSISCFCVSTDFASSDEAV